MKNIKVYTVTSPLHDEQAVNAVTEAFLKSLSVEYDFKGADFTDYGDGGLDYGERESAVGVCGGESDAVEGGRGAAD